MHDAFFFTTHLHLRLVLVSSLVLRKYHLKFICIQNQFSSVLFFVHEISKTVKVLKIFEVPYAFTSVYIDTH